jgi:1-acyl-sn-glycerol-3-phosphate acyltransferase
MALCRVVATVLLPLGYRFRSSGLAAVPTSGPVVLAPNHTTYLDPVFISYAVPRRVFYLAWHRLFSQRHFAWLIRSLGAVSLDTDSEADRSSYETALGLLRDGECLCLFPEGVRGWDGKLYPLQPGVARLALAAGAPIIPIAVHGGLDAWPRWRAIPRLFVPVRVEVLEPIHPRPCTSAVERRAETKRLLLALEESLASALLRGKGD